MGEGGAEDKGDKKRGGRLYYSHVRTQGAQMCRKFLAYQTGNHCLLFKEFPAHLCALSRTSGII